MKIPVYVTDSSDAIIELYRTIVGLGCFFVIKLSSKIFQFLFFLIPSFSAPPVHFLFYPSEKILIDALNNLHRVQKYRIGSKHFISVINIYGLYHDIKNLVLSLIVVYMVESGNSEYVLMLIKKSYHF